MSTPIPELEPHCGSWVVTAPDGRVLELFERENVLRCAEAGWHVETASRYLSKIARVSTCELNAHLTDSEKSL